MDERTEKIRDIILETNPYEDIQIDTELLNIIDSLTILNIVSELEYEYDLIIPENMVVLENFRTITSILNMLDTIKN